jgi:hypothetical protein
MKQPFAWFPVTYLTRIKSAISVITRKLLDEFDEKVKLGHELPWRRSTTPRRSPDVVGRGEVFE